MKLFNIVINDDDNTGMNFISLVEKPAVEVDFLKFNKQEPVSFHFDTSKHIITGVVCLADTPIYRYSQNLGEYYVVFTKDTIEKMMLKYSKMGLNNSVDLQHNEKPVPGVIMIESYIYNSERGVAPKEFYVPDGSWIASFKVENDALWNEIQTGNSLKGFSLSGFFTIEPTEEEFSKKDKKDEMETLIDELLK